MSDERAELGADVVRDLLRDQHPDLAGLPLRLAARGWDNQLWRLGDDLAVRLPWATRSADALLVKEWTWVRVLAPHLPLPVPVPQRLGQPSPRFPRPWLVTTWVPGEPADRFPVTHGGAAVVLADFLTALHRPAPDGAPSGRNRGRSPGEHAAGVARQLDEAVSLGLVDDPGGVRAVWEDALAAPTWDGPDVWLHGDLHPANVLTRDGALCGVVDLGDLFAGDPAFDLASAWVLLPDGGAQPCLEAYRPRVDGATWRRARGWAVARALAGLRIAHAAAEGHPGGKPTWGPPARACLRRLVGSLGP